MQPGDWYNIVRLTCGRVVQTAKLFKIQRQKLLYFVKFAFGIIDILTIHVIDRDNKLLYSESLR